MRENADLLIVGNGIREIYQAYHFAKEGKSVVLAVEGEYLMREFSEALGGFFQEDDDIARIVRELGITAEKVKKGLLHIPQGTASIGALNTLRKYGVYILFDAVNIGFLNKGADCRGAIFAGKFGVFCVKSKNVIIHEKQAASRFAFQLGDLELGDIKTPIYFEDEGDIKNICLNRDSKADDIGVVSFESNHENAYEAFEKMMTLIKILKKKREIFQKCSLLKTALTFEKPNLGNFSVDVLSDEYEEPDELIINGKSYPLKSFETDAVLDDRSEVEMKMLRLTTDIAENKTTSLIIAGAGTGGVSVYAAVKENYNGDVQLIEREFLPGGTRTLGMVVAFWHGYKGGFCAENRENIKNYVLKATVPCRDYTGELLYYVHLLGNNVMYSSVVCGIEKDGNRIEGVYVARDGKLLFIRCDFIIDATGDADVAVFSGCDYIPSGDARDGVTQSYSIWGETEYNTKWSNSAYKGDDDNISTECYSEYQRGIYITNSKNSPFGFSPMLTVRESRKIEGMYTLTMKDILTEKLFDDTISVSRCFYDAHGIGTSRAYYTILFEPLTTKGRCEELYIRIPLRSLMPKDVKNLIVVSKSISATRDAGCLIRMNADIQNTAYSAGIIVSELLNRDGKEIDLEQLSCVRRLLIDKGILPEWYNRRADMLDIFERINNGDVKAAAIASAEEKYLEAIERGFNESDKKYIKYLFASALAAHGRKLPFDYLLNMLSELSADEEKINEHTADIMSLCTLISNICDFHKSCVGSFVPVLIRIAETITEGGIPSKDNVSVYERSKIHSCMIPNFKTIFAIASAAERIAHKSLAKPLERLSELPRVRLSGGDDVFRIQLYIRLIAAAARCGSKKALVRLRELRNDEHLFFRNFVEGELESVDETPNAYTGKWDMWM